MIVNLKYFEKPQWSDFLSPGIAYYFTITNPSPRKILHALTALHFWLQFVSLVLLANSCLLHYGFGKDENSKSHGFSRFDEFYFDISLTFQICDIVLAVFASYHLRNAALLFSNNIYDVKIWLVINNLYVLSSITCFYFVFMVPGLIVVSVKAITICVFACSKIFIVHRIYKDEKSSYITLEQNGPFLNDSPKWFEFFDILLLSVKYCLKWRARIDVKNETIKAYNQTFGFKEIDLETYTFTEISNAALVMYTCYYLRKATYNRNLLYIHFWMIVNCINFVAFIGFVFFASLRLEMLEILVAGLLGLAFECYKLYIVYTFYMDEMYSVPAETVVNCSSDGQNAIAQNNLPNGVVDQPVHRNHHVVELAPDKRTDDRY